MTGGSERALWVVRLGTRPYAEALELQRAVARARIADEIAQDVLLLVEHPPVVTLGRTAKQKNLVSSPEILRARGVELFEVERGGDVTFHGPGQLVGYPILDLERHRKDLHWYLRQVEEALIRALAGFGIAGWRSAGYTGVWVGAEGATGGAPERSEPRESDDAAGDAGGDRDVGGGAPRAARASRPAPSPRKIASIGVHARDWVTWHGFALNVATDLRYFDLIVPCGIEGVTMTSMARELGRAVPLAEVERAAARAFGDVFRLDPVDVAPSGLGIVEALR